jgi:hypothetical protein
MGRPRSSALPPKEVRSLFKTLVNSQQLVHGQQLVQPRDAPWTQFFGNLGSSSVLREEEPEVVEKVLREERDVVEKVLRKKEPEVVEKVLRKEEPKVAEKVIASDTGIHSKKVLPEDFITQQRLEYFQSKIVDSVTRGKPLRAMHPFECALQEGVAQYLSPGLIRALFFKFRNHPFQAYEVFRFYQKMTVEDYGTDPIAYTDMYRHMCELLHDLNPQKRERKDIHALVHAIVKDLQQMDQRGKEVCFPVFVSSLVQQKTVGLGNLARVAFQYMLDHDFRVPAGYWEHLLSLSRYYRQDDLPYADILVKAVEAGRRPHPVLVLGAMGNLFPYHNTGASYKMLQTIAELQSTARPGEVPYQLDISTLEAISSAAAAKGFFDMNLAVWDMLDLLGYQPTEGIYENTILAFCARPPTYANAFVVLADMEEKGMIPSRALIRGMSTYLRYVDVECFFVSFGDVHNSLESCLCIVLVNLHATLRSPLIL